MWVSLNTASVSSSFGLKLFLLNYSKLNLYIVRQSTIMTRVNSIAGRCSDPMELTNAIAVGYEDPALERQNITFTCRPGQVLNGSNTSTCMGNGEWEPDPREVECTNGLGTTIAITLGMTYVLVITWHRLLQFAPIFSVMLSRYWHSCR